MTLGHGKAHSARPALHRRLMRPACCLNDAQARINPARGTPHNATVITMFTAGFLALFIDIELLAELVSIGTLVVFAMVCAGVLFRCARVRGSASLPARLQRGWWQVASGWQQHAH